MLLTQHGKCPAIGIRVAYFLKKGHKVFNGALKEGGVLTVHIGIGCNDAIDKEGNDGRRNETSSCGP
jgi:hypothetical protein